GLSVVTLNSLPARTLVAPPTGKSLPLRLRTATGCGGSPMRPVLAPTTGPPRPPAAAGAAPGPPRPAAAPGAAACAPGAPAPPRPAAAPGAPPRPPGAPPRPPPPPPAPIFMRPTSPLHTAAFQVGLISQAWVSTATLSSTPAAP